MIHIIMAVIREIRYRFKQIITPVIGVCVIGYLAYHSVQGDRGVLAYLHLNLEVSKAEKTLTGLKREHQNLAKKVSHLHPDSLDADTLDEMARQTLNLVEKNEIVVFYK